MLPILAQQNADDGPPDELIVGIIIFVCGFYLVLFIIGIFFLLTLQRALGRCRPQNRTMEPAMVWLNLIPLVSLVWMFITAIRVSESLRYEFRSRGWARRGDDYGHGLGIATCALMLAANIPYLGCLFLIGWVVCFILYWSRIAGYSNQLATARYDNDDYDDRDDDDDDRDDRDRDDRDDEDRRERRPWDRGR